MHTLNRNLKAIGIVTAVVTSVLAPMAGVMADGLAPCDGVAGYAHEFDKYINDPHPGQIVVSVVALPAFDPEWGLQIISSRNGFMLRSVQFPKSVWHGAYREVRPGYFERDPDAVPPEPIIHEVALSPDLARRLQSLVAAEVAHADPSNTRMGFDGEGFLFYAQGGCGFAGSPDLGTRPERLVDIIKNLKIQASLPSRWLQLFWEKRVLVKFTRITGSAPMSLSQYLVVMGLGFGIIVFGALPLLIAAVVMLVPERLARKGRFVAASGALSYGFTCFVALLLLPFFLIGYQVSAQLFLDGHSSLGSVFAFLTKYALIALFAAWVIFSVAVPIYVRRVVWPMLPTA
jgi:hypothetical protein